MQYSDSFEAPGNVRHVSLDVEGVPRRHSDFAMPESEFALPTPGSGESGADALPPILVADDDNDDLFFIERLIRKTGVKHPVKSFTDGSEVVNYLGALLASSASQRVPSLLFLDLKMAGLNGFGFLQWAREQKHRLPLTTVVLSNSSQPADMSMALALGAHRYLVKYPCVQTITTIVRSVYPFTLVSR
jgi:CheY-like chemotaxis protein